MTAPDPRTARSPVAAAFGLALGFWLAATAPGLAQAPQRFDLGDWTRKSLGEKSTVLFLECREATACGAGSAVSARLMARPAEPPTVAAQRQREEAVARHLREDGKGRIKDVVLGETRSSTVGGLPLIYTEKRVVAAKGGIRHDVTGLMMGASRAYTIIATSRDAEAARRNFSAFAQLVALILDQMAVEAAAAR